MNRKVLLLVLLGCMVCVGTIMFAFSDENLKLKKSHSFQASKNHEWGIDGYWSSDTDCQSKCKVAGGMSCGAYQQNCCVSSKCRVEKGTFSDSFYCDQRITVQGCTKPK